MSPATFHRFAELPNELQHQIWKYAAEDIEEIWKINDDVLLHVLVHATLGIWTPWNMYSLFLRELKRRRSTRIAMIQTCRYARLVAMQALSKDVMKIEFDEDDDEDDEELVQFVVGLACEEEALKSRWRMGL